MRGHNRRQESPPTATALHDRSRKTSERGRQARAPCDGRFFRLVSLAGRLLRIWADGPVGRRSRVWGRAISPLRLRVELRPIRHRHAAVSIAAAASAAGTGIGTAVVIAGNRSRRHSRRRNRSRNQCSCRNGRRDPRNRADRCRSHPNTRGPQLGPHQQFGVNRAKKQLSGPRYQGRAAAVCHTDRRTDRNRNRRRENSRKKNNRRENNCDNPMAHRVLRSRSCSNHHRRRPLGVGCMTHEPEPQQPLHSSPQQPQPHGWQQEHCWHVPQPMPAANIPTSRPKSSTLFTFFVLPCRSHQQVFQRRYRPTNRQNRENRHDRAFRHSRRYLRSLPIRVRQRPLRISIGGHWPKWRFTGGRWLPAIVDEEVGLQASAMEPHCERP